MSWTPASPITGGAQTGFTSPTYTPTEDTWGGNGKQYAITTIGGTQSGVEAHSNAQAFTVTFEKPKVIKNLGPLNANGAPSSVPRNVFKQRVRKGMLHLAGQPYSTGMVTTIYEIPAGADVADPESIRAMVSCDAGLTWANSSGIADTLINGIV